MDMRTWKRSLTLVVIIIVGGGGTGGCSSTVNDSTVEEGVRRGLIKQDVPIKSVDCPSGKKRDGDTFECTCFDNFQHSFPLTVTLEAGQVKWQKPIGIKVIDQAVVGHGIEGDLMSRDGQHVRASVECPDRKVAVTPPYSFMCDVHPYDGSRTSKLRLTVTAGSANQVTWEHQ
jgi:hypothetical protein